MVLCGKHLLKYRLQSSFGHWSKLRLLINYAILKYQVLLMNKTHLHALHLYFLCLTHAGYFLLFFVTNESGLQMDFP